MLAALIFLSSFLTLVELNCENLFDTRHDVGKEDKDFVEGGSRHWTAKIAKAKKANKTVKETVEITTDPDLVLPARMIYVLEDRNGNRQNVFADEVILLERSKLFAGSANALERYRKRMVQILAILGEIEKTTDGLQSRLHVISTEEPI